MKQQLLYKKLQKKKKTTNVQQNLFCDNFFCILGPPMANKILLLQQTVLGKYLYLVYFLKLKKK